MAEVEWIFQILVYYPFPSPVMPFQLWAGVSRIVDGQTTNIHSTLIEWLSPGSYFDHVELHGVEYDENSFHKWGVVVVYDSARNALVSISFDIAVPPFNETPPLGNTVHTQTHTFYPPPPSAEVAPTPPPPVVIPPPVGPPIDVVLEPPKEPPRRITLPPPVEPPPVDWRPGPLPPDITPPPRTRETDIFTLRAFAAKWGDQVDRYALNVPLDGGEVVAELEEPYRSFWQRLTMHKADIVFERKGVIYVAEIKPRLSRGAIGEAITAHELFKLLHKPRMETRAAVIVLTAHPTLVQTASWLDVLVFVCEQVDTGQPAGLYSPVGRRRS